MAPFAAAGVINEAELAKYVLQMGFGVKDPDQFIQAGPPPGAEMAPGEGAPPEQGPGGPPSPGMEQASPVPGGPPGPAPAGPSSPGGPVGAPTPGGTAAGMELPPELLQGLQMLMQQLPPEAQQQLVQALQQMPPEKRVPFVAQVVQEFMSQQQQAGPPPGAPAPPNVTSVGFPGNPPPDIQPGM
jgi:hypothetical protein